MIVSNRVDAFIPVISKECVCNPSFLLWQPCPPSVTPPAQFIYFYFSHFLLRLLTSARVIAPSCASILSTR